MRMLRWMKNKDDLENQVRGSENVKRRETDMVWKCREIDKARCNNENITQAR